MVDQNVGFSCLKLLLLILKAHKKAKNEKLNTKLSNSDRAKLVDALTMVDPDLIENL